MISRNFVKNFTARQMILTLAFVMTVAATAFAQGRVCTPLSAVTDDPGLPGGATAFTVTAGANSVTVDHVDAGSGLQTLTTQSSTNMTVTIPAFTSGTTNPVTVNFSMPNASARSEFTLRARSSFHGILITVRCETCTPITTVLNDPDQPGGLASFLVFSGANSVTIDHVNAGTGLQILTNPSSTNATVTIPVFTSGTFNPVVVFVSQNNHSQAASFQFRTSSFHGGILITATCIANPPRPTVGLSEEVEEK